jgi:ATP-binding cassette subfamily C protein
MARLWASPALLALFDAPWTPLFIALAFLFHPWLGWLALAGAGVLVVLALANQWLGAGHSKTAALATMNADRLADSLKHEAEGLRALGMTDAALARWHKAREAALIGGLRASDVTGRFAVASRTFRLFLQSAMLGLAAWLVLRDQLSPGAMIASSILIGRALQPVEQTVAHWPLIAAAQQARRRLAGLLATVPAPHPRTPLPRPRAVLEVKGLTVVPPGQRTPVLRGVGFSLHPGQALAVIGPSGAGKSALARVLCGLWPPAGGEVRLDGARLDQFDPATLGRLIGYLPQRVTLFEGTAAGNIARLDPDAPPDAVIRAAQAAAAHEMILRLPQGYDTTVSPSGGPLSGGQVQRIGLARALFGDPVLLILDEPNANLDHEGSQALNRAIRAAKARGAAVLVMAHRPAALQECDLLLVLEDGVMTACGPRDTILRKTVRNAEAITRADPGAAA